MRATARGVKTFLGGRSIARVGRADLHALLDELVEAGTLGAADNVKKYVTRLFNFALWAVGCGGARCPGRGPNPTWGGAAAGTVESAVGPGCGGGQGRLGGANEPGARPLQHRC